MEEILTLLCLGIIMAATIASAVQWLSGRTWHSQVFEFLNKALKAMTEDMLQSYPVPESEDPAVRHWFFGNNRIFICATKETVFHKPNQRQHESVDLGLLPDGGSLTIELIDSKLNGIIFSAKRRPITTRLADASESIIREVVRNINANSR